MLVLLVVGLLRSCLRRGYEVIGIDCFTNYYSFKLKKYNMKNFVNIPQFRLFKIDLSEVSIDELVRLISKVDHVIHEAAQPGVRRSWGDNFRDYVRHNILATQHLLEACVRVSTVKRFVYASSSSVYGTR